MTSEEILPVIARMIGAVSFFPSDQLGLENIAEQTAKFVDRQDRLDWLVNIFTHKVGNWHGMAEFRAVYCTRFRPADGLEATSELPGFTALDMYSENTENIPRLDAAREQKSLLEAGVTQELKRLK